MTERKASTKRGAERDLQTAKLDYRDESLIAWERSLGLNNGAGAASGAKAGPNVVLLELIISSPGVADISLPLTDLSNLRKDIVVKEGVDFSVSLKFKVNNAIVSGLTYVQVVKKLGISVSKNQSSESKLKAIIRKIPG